MVFMLWLDRQIVRNYVQALFFSGLILLIKIGARFSSYEQIESFWHQKLQSSNNFVLITKCYQEFRLYEQKEGQQPIDPNFVYFLFQLMFKFIGNYVTFKNFGGSRINVD